MDRRDKILAGLDLARLSGIEIGALDKPLVRPGDGPVLYVDHADTATLRQKYAADPGVNVDALVEVGAVWGERTLPEILSERAAANPGTPAKVDYVIASHVVEHVPDLVGWLAEIRETLKPTGELRLAVPDRRFTFDCLREDARVSDVLTAYLSNARRPLPQAILDTKLNAAPDANFVKLWNCSEDPAALTPRFDWDETIRFAREAITGTYHDVHCWAVTPYSLADIFIFLAGHDLLRLACAKFEDTEFGNFEFYLRLVPSDEPSVVAETWRKVKAEAQQTAPGSRFRPIDVRPEVLPANKTADLGPSPELVEQRLLAHERLLLVQAMEERALAAESLAEERLYLAQRMEARAVSAETALHEVRNSTSWRLTQPVRAAARMLRRQRSGGASS